MTDNDITPGLAAKNNAIKPLQKPKAPPSAFQLYCKHAKKKSTTKKLLSNKSPEECKDILRRKFDSLSDTKRKKYYARQKTLQSQHHKDLKQWLKDKVAFRLKNSHNMNIGQEVKVVQKMMPSGNAKKNQAIVKPEGECNDNLKRAVKNPIIQSTQVGPKIKPPQDSINAKKDHARVKPVGDRNELRKPPNDPINHYYNALTKNGDVNGNNKTSHNDAFLSKQFAGGKSGNVANDGIISRKSANADGSSVSFKDSNHQRKRKMSCDSPQTALLKSKLKRAKLILPKVDSRLKVRGSSIDVGNVPEQMTASRHGFRAVAGTVIPNAESKQRREAGRKTPDIICIDIGEESSPDLNGCMAGPSLDATKECPTSQNQTKLAFKEPNDLPECVINSSNSHTAKESVISLNDSKAAVKPIELTRPKPIDIYEESSSTGGSGKSFFRDDSSNVHSSLDDGMAERYTAQSQGSDAGGKPSECSGCSTSDISHATKQITTQMNNPNPLERTSGSTCPKTVAMKESFAEQIQDSESRAKPIEHPECISYYTSQAANESTADIKEKKTVMEARSDCTSPKPIATENGMIPKVVDRLDHSTTESFTTQNRDSNTQEKPKEPCASVANNTSPAESTASMNEKSPTVVSTEFKIPNHIAIDNELSPQSNGSNAGRNSNHGTEESFFTQNVTSETSEKMKEPSLCAMNNTDPTAKRSVITMSTVGALVEPSKQTCMEPVDISQESSLESDNCFVDRKLNCDSEGSCTAQNQVVKALCETLNKSNEYIDSDAKESAPAMNENPVKRPTERKRSTMYPIGCPVWFDMQYSKPCSKRLYHSRGVVRSVSWDSGSQQLVYKVETNSKLGAESVERLEAELAFATHCPVLVKMDDCENSEMEGKVTHVKPRLLVNGKCTIKYIVEISTEEGLSWVEEDVVADRIRYKLSLQAQQARIRHILPSPQKKGIGIRTNVRGEMTLNTSPPVLKVGRRTLPHITAPIDSNDDDSCSDEGDKVTDEDETIISGHASSRGHKIVGSSYMVNGKKERKGRQYTGVSSRKDGKSYEARISSNNKQNLLGHYRYEAEAALAYDIGALLLKRSNCKVNFRSTEDYELAIQTEAGQHVVGKESHSAVWAKVEDKVCRIGGKEKTQHIEAPRKESMHPIRNEGETVLSSNKLKIMKSIGEDLKQLRQDLSEEADEEVRAEILADIDVLEKRGKDRLWNKSSNEKGS